jgi:transposase-like protein
VYKVKESHKRKLANTYNQGLSFRDLKGLLAGRGVIDSHQAVRHWCDRFGPKYAQAEKMTIPIETF